MAISAVNDRYSSLYGNMRPGGPGQTQGSAPNGRDASVEEKEQAKRRGLPEDEKETSKRRGLPEDDKEAAKRKGLPEDEKEAAKRKGLPEDDRDEKKRKWLPEDEKEEKRRKGLLSDDEEEKKGRYGIGDPKEDCKTCKDRKYKDGSDEMVSFKSPQHVSPERAASAVRSHEQEHVSNAYKKAAMNDGKVVIASVALHMGICPECGRTYVAGGTTHTQIKYYNEENPYQKGLKNADRAKYEGMNLNYAV